MSEKEIKEKIIQTINSGDYKDDIKSISLFGSYLHKRAKKNSDIDLLIDLNKSIGFFKLVAIQQSLEQSIGLPVDLVTPDSLSKYFRDKVIREAEKIYG